MTRRRVLWFIIALFLLAPAAADDDPAAAGQQRLAFLKAKLAEFEVQADREPPVTLALAAEPALRWTNPLHRAPVDGATFFWLEGPRPIAAATLSIRKEERVYLELALVGDTPIVARREGQVVWSPRQNGLPVAPLAAAPTPAKSPALRLAQMRTLARRFHVTMIRTKRIEGRLLPQPLLRYDAPDSNLLDGAVFAFVEATDPEVLLVLEARSSRDRGRDDAHPEGGWQFSLARMTSQPVEVQLDKAVVWTAPAYYKNPRSPADAYLEAFEGVYSSETN